MFIITTALAKRHKIPYILQVYLNLLTITAIIRSTSTVMIAIVTILLVAILVTRQHNSHCHISPKTGQIPSRHSPQRLVAPVGVALALQERASCVLNGLALARKVRECIATNVFGLERYALAFPQSTAAPFQPIRTAQQLLPLLQLVVPRRIIGVSLAEQGRLVVLQASQLALCCVDIALVVPEALVDFDCEVLWDVRLLQSHGTEDLVGLLERALGLADGCFPRLA